MKTAKKKPTSGKKSTRTAASARLTRAEAVIELLTRKEGITIAEMQKAFGWQPHSCRGVISATNKKSKLGVTSAIEEGRGRVYRAKGDK